MSALYARDPCRWQQVESLFQEAILRSFSGRDLFLNEACGSDFELRREVDSLLASVPESDPFLKAAIGNAALAYLHQPTTILQEGSYCNQYRVIRGVGVGGMGEVYLAEDTKLKRKVALKVLLEPVTWNSTAVRRFEQEAQAVSALNHANLLTVFDLCRCEDRYLLVTEFVEGETLRQMLIRGPLPQSKAVEIAIQVAVALSAAHNSGVIHRDIKPENIMVRPDGCVKVLDFGIAKLTELPGGEGVRRTALTLPFSEVILGTPRYMSPEQARGLEVDARSDLFSLGAVFYEMLTGQAAFQGQTQNDLIADILRGDPPPVKFFLSGTSRLLQSIVSRALAKDRVDRYEKAEDLSGDLQRFRRESETGYRLRVSRSVPWILACLLLTLTIAGVLIRREPVQPAVQSLPRSLAILPFQNLRPSPDTDFLGFSLADEVISKLGYVRALTIRPSSAINRYRDGAGDLQKTAADLKTEMLLTGTYLKDGDDLQITARLIGFQPQAVLWQKTLRVKYDRLLTVQDRVTHMIVQGLALRLGPDEESRLKHVDAVNSLAYEYYMRGVDLYSISNFAGAIAMLEMSRSIDPNYAPTWAHLGRAYTTNASLRFGGRDDYHRAELAYIRAIELNPVFPEPLVYMANLLTDTGRVEESVPLLRVALKSSPNHAEAHWELGYAYRFGGMLKESAAECELARHLDPETKINSAAFNTYLYLGDYDRFLHSLPNNGAALLVFYHGLGSYYQHDYKESFSDFERAYDLAPDLLPAQIGKSLSEGFSHQVGSGLMRLRETENKLNKQGVADPEAMFKIAQAYAALGNRSDALRMLRRSTAGGFFPATYIARDPLLTSMHGSSEFAQILMQARERQDHFQRRFALG